MSSPFGQGPADAVGVVPSATMPPVKIMFADPPLLRVLLGSLSPETINAWILCLGVGIGVGVEIGVAVGVGEPPAGLAVEVRDGLGAGGDRGGGAETSVGPLPGLNVANSPVVGRL